jgi:alkylated DNA repair dioxygenase AlkB
MDTGKHIFADPELTDFAHLLEVLGSRSAWPPLLETVRERLESLLARRLQVCLCIHYKDGTVGAGLHTDMPEFGPVSFLTVISLGADREFLFRSKEDCAEEYRLVLQQGSLLTMGDHCQERYEHGLPQDPGCRSPRISLSYRQFGWD